MRNMKIHMTMPAFGTPVKFSMVIEVEDRMREEKHERSLKSFCEKFATGLGAYFKYHEFEPTPQPPRPEAEPAEEAELTDREIAMMTLSAVEGTPLPVIADQTVFKSSRVPRSEEFPKNPKHNDTCIIERDNGGYRYADFHRYDGARAGWVYERAAKTYE